jgi:hypothetical protein
MQGFLTRKPKVYRTRAADLLEEFINNFPHEKVRLSDLMAAIGARAYGVAILIFAVANLLISNIPGISTILGLPIILFGAQMMMGQPRPWLPKKIAEREFDRVTFERVIRRTISVLRKVETFIKPRLLFLAYRNGRMQGLMCTTLGIVLVLPILFGNWMPSWALALMALGMIERDGLLIAFGAVVGIAAVSYAVAFYSGLTYLVQWLAI